jgi:hypothetical protein
VRDTKWKETANMEARCNNKVDQQDPAKQELLAELHIWERQLVLCSLDEAIRLIESEKAEKLTEQHIHCIAEYDAITIDGECFFDKAFSSGKEVAACLAFAMEIGWREALDDMVRFRAAVLGPDTGAVTGSLGAHEAAGSAAIPLSSSAELIRPERPRSPH